MKCQRYGEVFKVEKQDKKSQKSKKKKYSKPKLVVEKVMAFGAGCNGMATGGRKASAGAPDFCSSSKLLS